MLFETKVGQTETGKKNVFLVQFLWSGARALICKLRNF